MEAVCASTIGPSAKKIVIENYAMYNMLSILLWSLLLAANQTSGAHLLIFINFNPSMDK